MSKEDVCRRGEEDVILPNSTGRYDSDQMSIS